jgi:hypothetical protein
MNSTHCSGGNQCESISHGTLHHHKPNINRRELIRLEGMVTIKGEEERRSERKQNPYMTD